MPREKPRREKRYPSAACSFDVPPPPPSARLEGRPTLYNQALTHAQALRRACLDDSIVANAIPAHWIANDDPDDSATLQICNVQFRIPDLAEEDPAFIAYAKDLDKDEAKFRAGRKDKHIGGEVGSVGSKKRFSKAKRAGFSTSRNYGDGELFKSIISTCKSYKRYSDVHSLDQRGSKRFRHDASWSDDEPTDYHAGFRTCVKEVVKAAKLRQERRKQKARHLKSIASQAAKELRRRSTKPIRVADEAPRRARKIVKQVLAFWRKEDRERQEERKKVIGRAEEQKKLDGAEREAQRQRNKLKYLLGQSESFSQFLQAKEKATVKADSVSKTTGDPMDSIKGDETAEQLKQLADESARRMLAKHQASIRKFDTETKSRKDAADALAAQRAENKKLVRKALPNMNGMSEDDRKLLQSEMEAGNEDVEMTANSKGGLADNDAKPIMENGKMIKPVRQPTILDCKMKDYQLRGLSWLVSLYDQGINGILADEMGLGKTLQTISLLAYLAEEENNWGPFLVVTPKATLHNWQQEVVKFCEPLKVLPYWGSKAQRAELRKYWVQKRMYRQDSEFHVCITSYETLTMDTQYFGRVKWQYMILDEAQAIKNSQSSRWRALLEFPCRNRLLLTGTPLQNKLSELWSLLHFIMPTVFDSHAEFADWFAKDIEKHATGSEKGTLDKTTLARLRTLLDPFMLRRVKRDVESEMPPKTELTLKCELSGRQRQLYQKVKANVSISELVQSVGGNSGADAERNSKLMNIVMQLRKVCNHPETFERREAISPFQFQKKPPPFHTPPPPSVLTGGTNSLPPLQVTLQSRSEIVLLAPRAIVDISEHLQKRNHLLACKYGLWNRKELRKRIYQPSSLSFLRLCDGLSVSDLANLSTEDRNVWNWRRLRADKDEQLRIYYDVYGNDDEPNAIMDTDEDYKIREVVTKRLHRRLLLPRAKNLNRLQSCIVLPGQQSPTDIIQRDCRLLKTTQVFIAPVSAPIPELYLPGNIRRDERLVGSFRRDDDGGQGIDGGLYPEMPVDGSDYTTEEVYEVWRNLLGNYGTHVGTSSISLPEAGRLIADSGKMCTLDPLLKKLKTEGHKVLIYSQFTKVLDILEDYCGKTLLKYVRLDGKSLLGDRRDIVAEFQTNPELFIFLLSTRAGGVGLNLTAADTVIFYDSDWNPTQDLQAMDRAHRLGQERPVTVYRLITPETIESRMLARAEQKSRINDMVIKGGAIRSKDENKTHDVTDIAALLMVEERQRNIIDVVAASKTARNAIAMLKEEEKNNIMIIDENEMTKKKKKIEDDGAALITANNNNNIPTQ